MAKLISFAGIVVLLLSGCGSGADNADGGVDGGDLTCAAAEFKVTGNVDGALISENMVVAGQALYNIPGDNGCYVNIYFEGGGRLRLEWENTLPDGQSAQATGSVNLETQGGINLGNCSGAGFVSQVTMETGGVSFVLHELRKAPYCSGAAVSGDLAGCAGFKNQ